MAKGDYTMATIVLILAVLIVAFFLILANKWDWITLNMANQNTAGNMASKFKLLHSLVPLLLVILFTIMVSIISAWHLEYSYIRYAQRVEISLAWFAMSWVLAASLQSYGRVWGIMAVIDRDNPTRNKVIGHPRRHRISSCLYWLVVLWMLFLAVQLTVGGIRDIQREDQQQQLIDRLDKLITIMEKTYATPK